MKKILLSVVLSATFVFTACSQYSSDHIQNHKEHKHETESSKILSSMHKAMMDTAFVESGDIERDFLANMIPHHQGAIDSSREFLKTSIEDKKIKNMVENIIKTQEKEIKEFNDILAKKSYTQTKISKKEYEKFVKDEKRIMQDMMHKMHSVKESKDINRDFLEAMSSHHQGAVDLSKQILRYSKDKKIRQIAENIIKTQEKEIKEFKEFLAK